MLTGRMEGPAEKGTELLYCTLASLQVPATQTCFYQELLETNFPCRKVASLVTLFSGNCVLRKQFSAVGGPASRQPLKTDREGRTHRGASAEQRSQRCHCTHPGS